MSAEQIRAFAEFFLIAYMIVVAFGAWILGYRSGRRDERKRRRATKRVRTYQTPKTLPSSAMPNMRQATVYTLNRRNHGDQVR